MSLSKQIVCKACGNQMKSISFRKAWEYTANGELVLSQDISWMSCTKCNHTNANDSEGVLEKPYPSNTFIPHYCPNCQISYFSSDGQCQVCGYIGGD